MIKTLKIVAESFRKTAGYTMTEYMFFVVIVSMLATGFASVAARKANQRHIDETYAKIEKIQKALAGFVRNNGYLPCPALHTLTRKDANFGKSENMAGVASSSIYNPQTRKCELNGLEYQTGAVPVRTLGLADNDLYDGWNRQFTYRTATGSGTKDHFNNIRFRGDIAIVDRKGIHKTSINDPAPFNSGAVYVVISHGENGKDVAWGKDPSQIPVQAKGLEEANTNHTNKVYAQAEKSSGFDDIVAYGLKHNFIQPRNISSPIQIENITCENAKAIIEGGQATLAEYAGRNGELADIIFNAAKTIDIMCDNMPDEIFNPANIPNMTMWFDADDKSTVYKDSICKNAASSGDNIACWRDKSGGGHNAIQSGSNKPVYETKAINNHASLRFNSSSSHRLDIAAFDMGRNLTFCSSFKALSAANMTLFGTSSGGTPALEVLSNNNTLEAMVWDGSVNQGGRTAFAATSTPYTLCYTYNHSGNSSQLFLNGSNIDSGNAATSASATTARRIGGKSTSGYWFNGYISEIVAYSRVLEDKERRGIENYLAEKWGVPLTGGTTNMCAKGLTFRKNKNNPGGSCQCPDGTVMITELESTSACNIPANNAFSGCVAVNSAPYYKTLPPDAGMAIWLDGNDCTTIKLAEGMWVEKWQDKSNNHNDATQSNAASRPLYSTNLISDKPGVKFNGTSQFLDIPSFSHMTAGEAFIVLKNTYDPHTVPSSSGLWNFGAGSGVGAMFPAINDNISDDFGSSVTKETNIQTARKLTLPNIYNPISVSGKWSMAINGMILYKDTTNTVSFSNSPTLGKSHNGYFYDGDIGELIIYDHELTNPRRALVLDYLKDKWGISLDASDLTNNNLTLWFDASDAQTVFEDSACSKFAPNFNEEVGCWKNKADNPNGFNLSQANTNFRPIYLLQQQNNKPVISFNGINNSMLNYNIAGSQFMSEQEGTLLIAYKEKTLSTSPSGPLWWQASGAFFRYTFVGNILYWDWGTACASSSCRTSFTSSGFANNFSIVTLDHQIDDTARIWVNGGNPKVSQINKKDIFPIAKTANFMVGGNQTANTYFSKMELGEIQVYNSGLTDNQRLSIEGYLGDKWGVPLP